MLPIPAVGERQDASSSEVPQPHTPALPGALRELRERAKLTQNELADRAQVDEKTIRRIELHPNEFGSRFGTLKRIAEALGDALGTKIDPHELLGREAPRLLEHDPIDPRQIDPSRVPDEAVFFVHDLAKMLRCSVRTLKRILEFRPWDLPAELQSEIDQRRRWARVTVLRWLEGDPTAAGSKDRRRLAARRQLKAVNKSRRGRSSAAPA